jgi:hypothetical protein
LATTNSEIRVVSAKKCGFHLKNVLSWFRDSGPPLDTGMVFHGCPPMMLGARPNLTPFPTTIIPRDDHCNPRGRLPARDPICLGVFDGLNEKAACGKWSEGDCAAKAAELARGAILLTEAAQREWGAAVRAAAPSGKKS